MFEQIGIWIVCSIAIYIMAVITPGIRLKSFGSAMKASLVLGFMNMTIRPVLLFLTLPMNILTLGFFTVVVNAIVLRIVAGLMKSFDINGWLPAILGAIILAIVQTFLFWFFGPGATEAQMSNSGPTI
jgi:putative membrane protein